LTVISVRLELCQTAAFCGTGAAEEACARQYCSDCSDRKWSVAMRVTRAQEVIKVDGASEGVLESVKSVKSV